MTAESEYWRGARDLALLELNELTALRAPERVRQRSLEIFLAAAELGARHLREEIGGVTKLESRGRPGLRLVGAARLSPSRARASRE